MRLPVYLLVVLVVLVVAGASRSGDAPRKADDERVAKLRWAESVLTDFFDALKEERLEARRGGAGANVRALLSEEMGKEFSEAGERCQMWRYAIVKSYHSELLEGQDEVVFTGRFEYGTKEYRFVARIVKGKDPSVWRIVYLRASEIKTEKAKAEVTEQKK